MNRRPPHREPVGSSLWKQLRVQNIARSNAALRTHYAMGGHRFGKTVAAYYARVRDEAMGAVIGYGIDHKGAWARVGEARARARTPEAALAAALAKHQETTG